MIFLFYLASLALIPVHGYIGFWPVLLVTFSFFVMISLCILFFETKNTLKEAAKASMIGAIVFQISYAYVNQVLQHTVNKPLQALMFLCFLGLLLGIDQYTTLGKQRSMVVAGMCLASVWGFTLMANAGVFAALLGSSFAL